MTGTWAVPHLREPPRLGKPRESPTKPGKSSRASGFAASLKPKQKASWWLSEVLADHQRWSNKGAGSQNPSKNEGVAFTWHFLYARTSQRNERGAEQGGICSHGKQLIENFGGDLLIYFIFWLRTGLL